MRPPPLCVVGCILALVLLCQSSASQQIQFGDEFNFVVLSDLHVGESQETDTLVQEAISMVNEIKDTKNISFVIITGDITSNAMPAEYQLARQYLDLLQVPYYPILGNHDIWLYTKPTTNTSWQEKNPTGDQLFVQYFGDIFVRDNIAHNFESVWNPVHGFYSTFINWELRLKSGDGYFILFGLDFVTRGGATNPKDLYKGAAPTAELQNFQGGTLFWLRDRLSQLPDDTISIVTAHHHTLVTTPFFIPDYFSMNYEDRDMFKNALVEYWPEETHWGALVGHMHFWDDQYALFPTYRQWETTAAKSDGSSGLTIASVRNGKIQQIQRCCGTTETGELLMIIWKAFAGAFLLVMSIYTIHHAYITQAAWLKGLLVVLGFTLLVGAQLYPFTGGTGILAKHMAVNLTGPIGLLLNLLFGIKSKVANAGYGSYFLLFVGTATLDFVRYPVRTNWLLNGENYNIFYTLFSSILALTVPALIIRKDKASRWGYPVLLSVVVGVLLELIGGSISAMLYRLILPITLELYNELIRVLIGFLVVVGIAQIWLLTSLAKNWNIILCIPIILASQTVCNAATQLLLRSSSFPIPDATRLPLFLAALLTVGATWSFARANKQEPKDSSSSAPSVSSPGHYVLV